jgi:hypothetical protein
MVAAVCACWRDLARLGAGWRIGARCGGSVDLDGDAGMVRTNESVEGVGGFGAEGVLVGLDQRVELAFHVVGGKPAQPLAPCMCRRRLAGLRIEAAAAGVEHLVEVTPAAVGLPQSISV